MLKSTNSIFKSAALLFAICFAGGAWATTKPKAVWNADFVEGAQRGGYTFAKNGNTIESDGTITIKSSANSSGGGVTVVNSLYTARPMTVIAAFENLSVSHNIALATSKVLYNGTTVYYNRTGLSLQSSDSKFYGWWNNTTGDSEKGAIYTNNGDTFRTITLPSATRHYMAYCYTSGVYGYDNGTEAYYRSGLTAGSDSGVYGFAVGGLFNSADNNADDASIKYIAILNSNSSDDIAYWSLTGMTAAETVANEETITGGSNVGVNLSTANMTATVSGATTAAAMFVQENATLEVTAGALTIGGGTGPLYVADDKTLTIDASDYDVSAMEDGDSIKIIGATLFGTVTLVAPADSSKYTYCLTVVSGEGVYLYARYKALNSININFYMDRESGYPADTAASKLTTSDPVGISGYQVPGNQWTEMAGKDGSLALTALDGTDAGTATISGAYQQGWYNTSFTANSDVRYGYIDDNANATTPTITISGVPFAAYKVVIYHSYSSANLGYDSIDGVNLCYSAGALSLGTSSWGQPNLIALVEGKNVLVSGVFSASTLTIKANRLSGTARANIAAIQIIQVDAPSEASTSVDVTAPSEDWSAVPTAAKTRTVCAGAVSFGNNSDYDATVGGRAATVVDIEDGYYGEINGLLKSGESYSRGERDTYLIMSGGMAGLVKGRQIAPWGGSTTKNTTGNALVQLEGNAVVDYAYGVGNQGGNSATLTGSSGVTVKGNAIVRGSVVGGWTTSHQATPVVTQNTSVRIENVQSNNSAAAQTELPNNYIVGGSAYETNASSNTRVAGNSSVVVDLPSTASGTFAKRIVGGSLCAKTTGYGGAQNVGGNSSVSITAQNNNVTFSEWIIGGGCNLHDYEAGYASTVSGNASVSLTGGTYSGMIVAGGYETTENMSKVSGTATLTVNSGTVFDGATLDAGNASQTKKLVANAAIDTSTVTVTGFEALDVGAGVTQTAIEQISGEFTEITVHDGAQYTAATSGTAALRVVSSTDGGTKGVVVFDGLSTSYTGDITIAANSKAKLVSGTYTGTFTVESGATLEIDPGAAYTCAASFTGAGSVVVKSGPVTFTGTNTLTNGMTVDSGATMIAEVTGNEGYVNVASGGTLKLYVTTDQYRYEGNVFKGTNSGTLEYWHGIEADFSDYVKVTDANSFNGNNLLPYYQIWKVVGEATSGTVNTAANWPGANAVPTVRADETYGNAAFYVEDDATVTVNIDATMNFKEIQVYGSGTVIFKGDGTNYLAANYLYMTSGVNVEISGGDALRLSNGEIVAASSSQTITVNSGAKLTLNNISCDNKIVVGGTLETSGETTLSAANTSAQGSLIRVLSGETLLSTLLKGIKGNIRIDDDAVLRMVDSLGGGGAPQYYDNIDPDGTTQLDIYGTLDFKNNGFEAGEDITINLYDGAEITAWATVNSATYGDMAWLESGKVTVTGRVTLNTTIRTKTGAAVEFDVGADAVLTINKNFVLQSSAQDGGGSLTKSGAGTLKFTQETLTKPLTISAGKVQLKRAFTSGLAISIDSGAELELGVEQGDSDVTSISFANITGTGTIRYSSTSTGYYTMPSSAANMFATTLHVANDNTAGGVVIAWNNGVTTNRTMSGSGKYRSDWGGTKDTPSRYLLALQDDNSEWSGVFHQNDRLHGLKVAGVAGAANKTLTLSGTQDQTNTLEIESSGSAKLTGTWIGDTTVDGEFGGTGSLTGDLTFNAGSTFKVWATGGLTATGVLTLPEEGKITVDVSELTIGAQASTTILTVGSGMDLSKFNLVGSNTHFLQKSGQVLNLVPIAARLTNGNSVTPFAGVDEALGSLYLLAGSNGDAYVTVTPGFSSGFTDEELLETYGIFHDTVNGIFGFAAAEIGTTTYVSLSAAVAAASASGDTITLLRDTAEQEIALNNKSITLDESSYTFSGSFTGNGTLVLPEGTLLKSADASMWLDGWVGTVWVKGINNICGAATADSTLFEPNKYGREGSVLKLSGIKGWILGAVNPGVTINPTIEIEDATYGYGLWLNDGYGYNGGNSTKNYTVLKGLKGTGTLIGNGSGGNVLLQVEGWNDFAGTLTLTNKVVVFGSTLPEEQAHIEGGGYILVKSGESVEVPAGKTWTVGNGVIVNGNLSLGTGAAIVNTTAANTWVKRGTGTITLNAPSDLPATPANDWTGTVVLPHLNSIAGDSFSFNSYGVEGSTVRVSGIDEGWLKNEEVNPTIDIPEGVTLTISDFSPSFNNTFKALSGAGTFAVSTASAPDASGDSSYTAFFLLKDVSDFTGSLSASGAGIAIADSRISNSESGNRILVASGKSVTVGNDKTWTAPGGITVDGTVNAAAVRSLSGTISGSGLIAYESMPGHSTTSPSFGTWSGTIELPEAAADGIKLAGYGTSTSKIKVNGITSGYLMWEDQDVQAEVVLAGGINITATSHRNYTYAHISGTGFISVANGNEQAADPDTLTITRLDVASGSVGMAVTNTTSTTLTITTLALAEGADVSTGAKILSKGGTGTITVGGVTLGGVAISPSLEYKTDGVYIALDPGVGYMDDTTAVITNTASIVTTIPASATVAKIFPVTEGFVLAAEDGFAGSVQVLAKYIDANEDVQEQNIAGIFTIAGYGTIWTLNSSALVGGVKLQPEVAATTPMTMGANTTFSIKTIPGLYYAVQTGSFNEYGVWVPAGTSASGNAVQAISGTTSVTAPELDEDDVVKYYRIGVGLTPDGAK